MMASFIRTMVEFDGNYIGATRIAMTKMNVRFLCVESRRKTIKRIFLTILLINVKIVNVVASSNHRIARGGEPNQNANQPNKNLNVGSFGYGLSSDTKGVAGGGIAVAVSLTETEPEFTTPIRNITTPVGKEAVLSCTVDRIAKYKVGWLKAEDQTILTLHDRVVTHNVRISVTHDNRSTWRLHIRQVKESDRGCYMCQINTNVMKKQIGCIDVHVPPDILYEETSTDVSIREGDNASLVCRATGHPAPKITWRREDSDYILMRKNSRDVVKEESYNGSTLFFWKVDRKQMGAYLCVASNDVPPAVSKRIILSVNFSPTIRVPNQLLGAPLNTDVQLECTVEAYPNTVNYWDKNGEIIFDGSKYSVKEWRENYTVRMRLLVRHFNKTDIGTYKCVSTNSVGRAEGVLRLYDFAETSAKRKFESNNADKTNRSSRNRGYSIVDTTSSTILLLTYLAVIYNLYGRINVVLIAR